MYSVVQLVSGMSTHSSSNESIATSSNLFTANTTISASGTRQHDGNYHVQLCLEARIYIRDSPLFPFSSFFSLAYPQYTETSDLESSSSLSDFVHIPIARSIVLVGNSFPPRRLSRVNPLKGRSFAPYTLHLPLEIPLVRAPFSAPISKARMSTSTAAASGPTVEKKPIKFSNLLRTFFCFLVIEVWRRVLMVYSWRRFEHVRVRPLAIRLLGSTDSQGHIAGTAAGSDQDDHGCQPGRQLRRCYGSDMGSWWDLRLYVSLPGNNLRRG